jgi:hypothetical protein
MTLPIEFQAAKLADFVTVSLMPQLDRWRVEREQPGYPVEKVYLGHTLLELIGWACVGIELEVFPRSDGSKIIQAIFGALGAEYRELKEFFSSEWSSASLQMLKIADSHSVYPGSFYYPVTDSLQGRYQMSVLIANRLVEDNVAQEYLMRQAFSPTEEWEDQMIRADTLEWARSFQENETEPAPFWVSGYLKAIEYFDSFRSIFAGVDRPALAALKQETYDLIRWRLNLRIRETRRRFDLVTESVIAILDLIEPAVLRAPAKEQLNAAIVQIRTDFISEIGLVVQENR